MKVIVTPRDDHPVEGHPLDHHDHGEPFTGHSLSVGRDGVWVDAKQVLKRDRRAAHHRLAGHPWLTNGGIAIGWGINWTSFTVEVMPNE